MDITTIFLAQIFGVYLLVMGLSVLVHPARIKAAMQEFTKSVGLPYFGGALAILVGMLIVLSHNEWNDLPSSLVSLVGWISLIKGITIVMAPEAMRNIIAWFKSDTVVRVSGSVIAVVGAYLAYVGFLA